MKLKNILLHPIWKWLCLCLLAPATFAQTGNDGLGQTIQIHTRLHSFVGKPSWLIIVRDIDHNQNIPYVFDIQRGNNFWVIMTYARNYLITVSKLQFSPYRRNPYNSKTINNFCQLESRGAVIKGESIFVTIDGDLTPNQDTFSCNVARYANTSFTVAPPATEN